MADTAEKPFTLSVPEADLELLRKKLELVRLPDELDGANWDYGAPLADIKRLVTHWKDSYDWRKSESEINKLPMFTRDIEVDGHGALNIHYIHQKSEVKNAIPLLFVHGCTFMLFCVSEARAYFFLFLGPGDFLEVRKMLPLLTAKSEGNPSFHVVALSLPGFGFSEAPKKPGFAGAQYAEVREFEVLHTDEAASHTEHRSSISSCWRWDTTSMVSGVSDFRLYTLLISCSYSLPGRRLGIPRARFLPACTAYAPL